MDSSQAIELLQRLTNPALRCLVAMLIGHYLQGADVITDGNLRTWGSMSQDTIGRGMEFLRALVFNGGPLVECLGRNPNRWRLSSTGRQLLLPVVALLQDPKTPQFAESAGGGSSSFNNNNSLITTTTTPETPQIAESALPLDLELLVRPLVRLGCPRERALEAVAAARERGETVQALAEVIVAGELYTSSARGRSIFHPGAWLAACIAEGRGIPATAAPRPAEDLTGYDGYTRYTAAGADTEEGES